ncbi:MAG: Hsp70 family protein [Planctomycetaceae bacterium]|nr:Hsp70 family protein [Planctomycetaceae bacterium]MCB9950047.1 Hsp70 family protein [Planctomycetaceae bacterium]
MKEIPIGIDLGTTFSVIAYLDAYGRPQTIRSAEGEISTPSVVMFEPGPGGVISANPVVGRAAVGAAAMFPEHVAEMMKRDMGRDTYHRPVAGRNWRPELLQSFVLAKLKHDAQLAEMPFRRAVITVPAYFNNSRRECTIEAAALADIEPLAIINEPTAAALVYGTQHGFVDDGRVAGVERILVYDLGGGTFDVTLMEIEGREFRVIGTDGDVELGGRDWDVAIANRIAEEFMAQFRGRDPRLDGRGFQKLMAEAENAKRMLSNLEQTVINLEIGGDMLRMPLSRTDFEGLTIDLLERTVFTSDKVVRDAGLNWGDLTRILLVGGSTKMPAIARRLEEESGIAASKVLAADEAVAHGAAIYAGLLLGAKGIREIIISAPQLEGVSVKDICSHSLGMLVKDRKTRELRDSVIIEKGSRLPAQGERYYETTVANQRGIKIRLTEAHQPIFENVIPLPELSPPLPERSPVRVEFTFDNNGCLEIVVELLRRMQGIQLSASQVIHQQRIRFVRGELKS